MMTGGFQTRFRMGVWLDSLEGGVRDAVRALAPARPDGCGLNAFSSELAPREVGTSGRRALAHFIASQSLALEAFRADVGGRRLTDPATLDVNLARIADAHLLACETGAARLVVPLGYVPPEGESPAAQTSLREAVKVLCALATGGRARICISCGGEPPAQLLALLNTSDPGGILEADLNPGSFISRGVEPLKAISALGARASIATCADHYRGGGEAPFGSGDVQWGEVLVGLSTLREQFALLAACTTPSDKVRALTQSLGKLRAVAAKPF